MMVSIWAAVLERESLKAKKHQCTRGYKRYKEMFQICRVEKSDFPLYFYILAGCAD